jgi:hypothetical protein
MTIFQLFVYSCITLNAPISGELLQKTCNWSEGSGNSLYVSVAACESAAPAAGTPVFSDVMDGRKVEKTKCEMRTVLR